MNEKNDDLVRQLRAFSELEPSESAIHGAIEHTQQVVLQRLAASKLRSFPVTRQWDSWLSRVAACVGGLLILGVLILWTVPLFFGGTAALAEAVAKMNSARSVCFDAIVSSPGAPDQKISTAILGPHLRRDESSGGTIAINDAQQGKWLMLEPQQKKAYVAANRPRAQTDLYEEILHVDPAKAKQLPAKDINGHRCVGFVLRTVFKKHSSEKTEYVSTKTVWVDEETRLPVRIENVYSSDKPYLNLQQVLTNFVFDKPLDESLFSLIPPEGYELVKPTDDDTSWTVAEPPKDTTDDE